MKAERRQSRYFPDALLWILAQAPGPLSRCAVMRRFAALVGETWKANSGQAYSTLVRLERDGFVTRLAMVGAGRAEQAYRLTEAGRRRVQDAWSFHVDPVRRDIVLRVATTSTREDLVALERDCVTLRTAYVLAAETLDATLTDARGTERASVWAQAKRHLCLEAAVLEYGAVVSWLDLVVTDVRRQLEAPRLRAVGGGR